MENSLKKHSNKIKLEIGNDNNSSIENYSISSTKIKIEPRDAQEGLSEIKFERVEIIVEQSDFLQETDFSNGNKTFIKTESEETEDDKELKLDHEDYSVNSANLHTEIKKTQEDEMIEQNSNLITTEAKGNQYKCNTCGRIFLCSYYLKCHQRIHNNDRPFHCPTCPKRFTRINTLRQHEKIHTGEKPFKCTTCSRTFNQMIHLQQHERTHTGERPFQCNTCSKTFTQAAHLKVHERIHTGERPFRCEICSKTFTFTGGLKDHMRTHTGEKPYECKICATAFTYSGDLKRHMRQVHDKSNASGRKVYGSRKKSVSV